MVVIPVHVGRVPRVLGVIHRRLSGSAILLREDGVGGAWGSGGSLRRLRCQFGEMGQGRRALNDAVELRLGEIWGIDVARLACLLERMEMGPTPAHADWTTRCVVCAGGDKIR